MLSEFDELVKKRAMLKAWWSLGDTVARYDNRRHSLRVDIMKPAMVAFCGQDYAGAKNYHDAPAFFVESIRHEIAKSTKEFAQRAYEAEIARLDEAIDKHRAAVLSQLEMA